MATLEEKLERARAMTTVRDTDNLSGRDTGGMSFGVLPKKTDSKTERAKRMQGGLQQGGTQDQVDRGMGMLLRGVDNITLPLARNFEEGLGGVRVGGEKGIETVSPSKGASFGRVPEHLLRGEETPPPDSVAGGLAPDDLGPPQNPFERGMEFAGETMTLTGPLGAGFRLIPPGAKTTLLGKAQRFLRNMGNATRRNPGRMTAIEGAAGFGAGAVGGVMGEITDSPAAIFVAEMLGGVAGPGIAIPLALRGRSYLKTKMEPYGDQGGPRRGRQRFERAFVGEREGRERALRGLEEPTTIDPRTGQPVLTPAQRTGDVGAMELEKDVMSLTDELAHEGDEKLAWANSVLQQELKATGEGGSAEEAQAYLMELFNVRLRAGAHRIAERVAKIADGADSQSAREAANVAYDAEIRRITEVLDKQVDELFEGLPPAAPTPSRSATQRANQWLDKMGNTGKKNIPRDVEKFLSPTITDSKGQIKRNPQYVGEMTTLREMRNLQSNLRTEARRIRKDNPTKAEIADDIANAINDDIAQMQAVPEVRERLDLAVNFARDTNEILGKFKLGQMGGRSFTIRNRPVDPQLAAERSIGLGGQEGKAVYNQIIKAIRQTKLPFQASSGVTPGESPEVLRDTARQYFRSLFMDTVEGGEIKMNKAREFMRTHRPMLEVLPDLRDDIARAIQDQDGLNALRAQVGEGKYRDMKVSKAALFTQRDPMAFFKGMLKENPRLVQKDISEMWKMVNKDELGHAQRGLKGAWTDFLLSAGETGTRDIRDSTPLVSGAAIKEILDSPQGRAVTRTLFNQTERQRLRTVVNDLVKLEKRRRLPRGSKEGVLGDKPNFLQGILVRFGGAEAARQMHQRTGVGGSIQQVSMGIETFKKLQDLGVRDPALHFIISGIHDEGLWKQVLMQPATPNKATAAKMRKRLHAWAATMLYERGIQIQPEEEEQQPPPQPRGESINLGDQSSFAPGY